MVRIIIVLTVLLLNLFSIRANAQLLSPPFTKQSIGGSEVTLKKRSDISDSTYQVFFRYTQPCWSCNNSDYIFPSTIYFNFYDTCNNQLVTFTLLTNVANRLLLNPFTMDSTNKRIFKVCGSGSSNYIGGINGTTIFPGYQDTFEVIKDFWYSKLIDLPYKCGMWEVSNIPALNNMCNLQQGSNFFDMSLASNIDSNDIYGYPGLIGIPYNSRGITQINTNVANSSPYFLSYPVAHYPKNVPITYKQNAVDPDGDSLVWSSLHMVWFDTVHGIKPLSYWAPFVPQKECLSAPYYNMPLSPVSSGLKKVPGYACIPGTGTLPNCIKYDPVINPFDTDSTYYLNPQTGDVTFIAKSSPQTARLLLRCDEYRQGVWVGSVNRRVDFFITDSMYYNTPTFKIDTPNLVNCYLDSPYVFYACKNQALSIPFTIQSNSNQSYLSLSDNHSVSMPTSTLTYQNNISDSVRGTLQWTPSNADTGWHQVLVRAYDSSCSLTPYIQEHNYLLRIYVSGGMQLNASDTTICAGQSVQLQATGLGNNIVWSQLSGTPGSLSCTQCANPWATPSTTSVYVASGNSTGLSCVVNDTVTVKVVQDFTLNATDTTVCFKNDLMLKANATGQNTSLSYQWSPATGILGGSNNSFVMVVPSNINYYVTATDSLGCFTHTDTASIVYDSTFTPSYDIDKNGICTGDTVSISVLGGINVVWSPNYNISALTGNGVMAWPDTSMTYVVELTNANLTCKTEMNIPVKVTALRADAGPDYEIFDGEAVILGGPNMLCGEGCKLEWFPDKWLFFNFMQNPKAVPHVTTTYWVMVRNETGNCVDRDSVTVSVKCTDIYMPNAFSPTAQSDDYTRLFGPRNVSLDLEYFRIFNRWGQLVFETRDVSYRWDGKFKGVAQPMDTYVWVIRGKCPNGQLMEKKGNVTLLR